MEEELETLRVQNQMLRANQVQKDYTVIRAKSQLPREYQSVPQMS
jgi:hypothetical protein